MLETLLFALYIGLGAATINIIVRSAPIIDRWMLEGKKPWVCDVCMTLWTSIGITVALAWFQNPNAVTAWLPGYAIGKWALGKLSEPLSLPPTFGHHMDPLPADLETPSGEDTIFIDPEEKTS